jgi:molybdopterin-synthase adenylyltransferase
VHGGMTATFPDRSTGSTSEGPPRLRPGWAYSAHDEGVLLVHATRRRDPLLLRGPSSALLELLDRCDGRHTVESVEAAVDGLEPRSVRRVLELLEAHAVAERTDPLEDAAYAGWDRYVRQLEVFEERLGSRSAAAAAQQRLADARVTLVGLGGVGHWLLMALSAAGIRAFTLVDPDDVDLSNLSRQVLFEPTQVGMPKVDAAAGWLRRFDPEVEVTPLRRGVYSAHEVEETAAGSTLVVLAAGHIPSRIGSDANGAALRLGIPLLLVGGGSFGPFVVPGETACVECVDAVLRASSPVTYGALREHPPRFPTGTHTPVVVGPIAIAALWAANDVVAFLTGTADPAAANRVVKLEVETPTVTELAVERDPACRACGGATGRREESAA